MKSILKKSALWCVFWLMAIIVVNFVKAEVFTIPTNLSDDYLQKVRLHTLLLWRDDSVINNVKLEISKYWEKLYMNFGRGLVVGKSSIISDTAHSEYVVIWWWEGNTIDGDSESAGIAGWKNNTAVGDSAVVGWWWSNKAWWANAVVAGWNSNNANVGGVVAWWQINTAYQWGVILWWTNNKAAKNSLALWSYAESQEGAFWWNATASENSAYINATNWTLVGTYQKIDGVNLVVDGAVQFEWKYPLITDAVKWEIRAVNGCLYAYDGNGTHWWHVITRWVESDNCGAAVAWLSKSCPFWDTFIWEWDIEIAYKYSYVPTKTDGSTWSPVTSCSAGLAYIICYDGNLYEVQNGNEPDLTKNANGYYPYCYKMN